MTDRAPAVALVDARSSAVAADDDLMVAVRGGSREAFEGIFERYRAPVWAFFRRRVPDEGAAAELTQDVFVAVLEAAARYEPRDSFRSYIFGVAHHVLSAWRRRSHVRGDLSWPADLDPPASGSDPIAVLWIRRALSELEADDREILMLREYDARRVGDRRGMAALADLEACAPHRRPNERSRGRKWIILGPHAESRRTSGRVRDSRAGRGGTRAG
jgi:RNA polymerase sigma-70 factor (ECF subfamily)